jgi:hypothetical protein
MTTRVTAKEFRTFSELQAIADSNALNENLGNISEKNDTLNGSGVLFAPLPGFYLGYWRAAQGGIDPAKKFVLR